MPSRHLLGTFGILAVLIGSAVAQDSTSYLTPDVARVGEHLACRCGGCRNTVGNCPMIKCSSADPKRRRIFEMKQAGLSDDAVVNQFVREEGNVALSAPPSNSLGGIISWAMPPIALLLGFWIYVRFVKGNRQVPVAVSEQDRLNMERFRHELDAESDETPHR